MLRSNCRSRIAPGAGHLLTWIIVLIFTVRPCDARGDTVDGMGVIQVEAATSVAAQCNIPQLGVFFDVAGTQTTATISPFVPFTLYVHAFNVSDLIGWSASLEIDGRVSVVGGPTLYPAGATNATQFPGFDVDFGTTCVTGADVLLAVIECMVLMPTVESDLTFVVGPSQPGPLHPVYVTCSSLVDQFSAGIIDPDGPYPDNTAVGNPSFPAPLARPCPPVAIDDPVDWISGSEIIIDVVANDVDSDGTIVAASVRIAIPPTNGVAQSNGDGTITFSGADTGSHTFGYTVEDDDGLVSNVGTITVNKHTCPPEDLQLGVPVEKTTTHYELKLYQDRPKWMVVDLTHTAELNVDRLNLLDDGTQAGCCVQPVGDWGGAGGIHRMIVGDFNHLALGNFCVEFASSVSDFCTGTVDVLERVNAPETIVGSYLEWDSATGALIVNGPAVGRSPAPMSTWLVDIYEVELRQGKTYLFELVGEYLDYPPTFTEPGNWMWMRLFSSGGGEYWQGGDDAMWIEPAGDGTGGPTQWEDGYRLWTPPADDTYAVVVNLAHTIANCLPGWEFPPELKGGYTLKVSESVPRNGAVKLGLAVHDAVPNPSNPSTTVSFELGITAHVRVDVYDLGGRWVNALLNETRSTGRHAVTWDGRDANGAEVASGVYFVSVAAGGLTESKRVVLVK